MDSNVFTPLKLWENFKTNTPLEISFIEYNKYSDDLIHFSAYFTAYYVEGKPIRVYVKGFVPINVSNPASILYVNDYSEENTDFFLNKLARAGYFVATFDYVGKKDALHYTRYPAAVSYGNLTEAGSHLSTANPTPKDTCSYLWATVCRRALTFMRQFNPNNPKLAMVGYGHGADIMWQAAATDGTVDTIIPVLNAGWDINLVNDDTTLYSQEKSNWLICCTPQSYSKFIKCPVLFIGNSNCSYTILDKLESTLSNIPKDYEVKQLITAGLDLNLSKRVFPDIIKWLNEKLMTGSQRTSKTLSPTPEFSLYEKDGKLMANVSCDTPCKVIKIYYSINEDNPSVRSWETLIADNYGEYEIPVQDNLNFIIAFANVEFTDRTILSSNVREFMSEKPLANVKKFRRSPLIYEKKNQINGFFNYNKATCFVDLPYQAVGGLDITGITVENGDLLTYRIGTESYSPKNETSILQFDGFSLEDRVLDVLVLLDENDKLIEYKAVCHLKKDEWTRCSLEVEDFNNSSLKPLKTWTNVKALRFVNLNQSLINNVIWV